MAALRQTPLTCSGHTRPVVQLAFSQITPTGVYLLSACKDGKPMLRQGDTGDWIGTFEGHKGAVWGVALSRDALRAATGAADFTAKVWNAKNGDELHTFTHQHIVKSVDFSRTGSHLLTGSNEKILKLFDLNKPEAEPEKINGHTSNIRQALFLGDNLIISAADDKTVRLWDRNTLQEIKNLPLESAPTSLELSADGNTVTISYGSNVGFWKSDTLEPLKQYKVPTQVNSATLHPDNSVFVCGGEDFKAYKFKYESGEEIESFKGHFGPIHCIRFSPDGEVYASGSEDGTLRLWQTTVGKTYGLWKCVISEESGTTAESNNVT